MESNLTLNSPTMQGTPTMKAKRTCEWEEDRDGNWETACGEMFVIIDGTPTENSMRYCPYCGNGLKEVRRVEDKL